MAEQFTITRREKWDRRFMAMTEEHPQTWSKDPSTQVGALLVSPDRRTLIVGYNGFPSRIKDDAALYADREQKLKRTIHAEVNAILNAKQDLTGFTLYCPIPPCGGCAPIVIQAGIGRVVYRTMNEDYLNRWHDSITFAFDLFEEAGIELTRLT